VNHLIAAICEVPEHMITNGKKLKGEFGKNVHAVPKPNDK
jgi:hypothetical protein